MAVTCRVLKLARQPYYRWRAHPITDAGIVEAYRANALFDAHKDGPEFGYRYLVEEARDAGEPMAERIAWRICSQQGLWSVFGKKRGKNGKPGPPVHDDLVERRGDVAGCILHSDRGSQFRSRKFVHALHHHGMVGSMGRVGAAGDNAAMESFFSLLQKSWTVVGGIPIEFKAIMTTPASQAA